MDFRVNQSKLIGKHPTKRQRRLFDLACSLSPEAQSELDGIIQALHDSRRLSSFGYISAFELAMVLLIFISRRRKK